MSLLSGVRTWISEHTGFAEGQPASGTFHIEQVGTFNFNIPLYGVPFVPSQGAPPIRIFLEEEVRCTFHRGDNSFCGSAEEAYLRDALLAALMCMEERITGTAPGTLVSFPLPKQERSPSRPQ